MDESFASQSFEKSLRKVAEGKLSPCLAITYNARIPKHQALRIIDEGMEAAIQTTHLKPKYHQIYRREVGLIGVLLEFPGKSMIRRITTIHNDFTNRFISEVLFQIKSLGMRILRYESVESVFMKKEEENNVGLCISFLFLPPYPHQSRKKITKRIFKIDKDKYEFMLVHDRSYD